MEKWKEHICSLEMTERGHLFSSCEYLIGLTSEQLFLKCLLISSN